MSHYIITHANLVGGMFFLGVVCGCVGTMATLDRRGWLRTPKERASILVRRQP